MRFVLLLLICFISAASTAEGLPDRSTGMGGVKKPGFHTPDHAFGFDVAVRDAQTLQANFNVARGYYLYRDRISFSIKDSAARIMSVSFPKGEMKHDPNFGDMEVFHHPFQVEIILDRVQTSATGITLNTSYQGCSELGLCYLPIAKATQLDMPDAKTGISARASFKMAPSPSSAGYPQHSGAGYSQIANLLKDGNFWLIVSFYFGAGLLLSLTPCVFPMIPILSGIIVGRGHKITQAHAFFLSLAFVLGIAITYAAAGVAAGFSGNLISNALQTPWVLGSFAGVFVLLSLSMFGFYELQLPGSWQSKLSDTSNRLHGGHLGGVFVMGALSSIIMGPCVTAPLAGALLYIGQTHDAVLGGVMLFVLALGMGAPLLLIGTSAGVLLPKAGAWMDAIKRFFGVLLLALAIWIIQPLLHISVQMFLWALLLILSATYLRVLDTLPHNASGTHKFITGIGRSVAALLGIAYLIGALTGASDILHPLGGIGKVAVQAPATLQFSRIKDITELEQRLAQAHGQPVMLNFYADWCASCKEMERNTFSDTAVQAKLKPVLLLQADVTANSEADKALLKRYGMYGPPGILFFDAKGKELSDNRVMGYLDATQFLQSTVEPCKLTTVC